MRINKTTMTGVALALALGAGMAIAAETKAKATDPKAAEAAKLIQHAEMARKRAASVDSEWRDTGKFIKKAQALLKEGKYDAAIKLAKKAKRQGELGYEQGTAQSKLRIPSYFQSYYGD